MKDMASNGQLFDIKKGKCYVEFSPDYFFKNKSSGGGLYKFYLNQYYSFDTELKVSDSFMGLMDYLRLCFKWAGFPNMEYFQDDIPDYIMKVILDIRKSLLPI